MEPVLPFEIDLSCAGGRLSASLHQQLRTAILDGRLAVGSPLPATRRLAAELGIARNTVVAAYDLLTAEGYVLSRRGASSVVADLHRRASPRKTRHTPPVRDKRLAPCWRTRFPSMKRKRELRERSFRLGMPDGRHFPHATWRRLATRALRKFEREPFHYPPTEGFQPLRAAIAQHVAFTRAVTCTTGEIIVTSGAQQAFDLMARLLVTPGKTAVAVENPGYPPLCTTFAAAGARLVPIPVDDDGMCVDALPNDIDIVSVTPSHQTPTGSVLSLDRRMALLDFARQRNAVIIEDDYDAEFRYGPRPLDALQTLDREARVFYVGTFSKTLFPSLRKGFVVVPHWAQAHLIAVKECTDAHCDDVMQSVLASFIQEGHMLRHVRRMQPIYARRRNTVLDGIAMLQDWLEPIPSEAGLHTAAWLRDPSQSERFFKLMRRHTPGAQSSSEYALTPAERPAAAFGYGVIDVEDIRSRMNALRTALSQH